MFYEAEDGWNDMAQDPINDPRAQQILKKAVLPSTLASDGMYTKPRSWGVYEILPTSEKPTTRRYRIGNHPIRQRELEAEFGKAKQIALFVSRSLADELQRILNGP